MSILYDIPRNKDFILPPHGSNNLITYLLSLRTYDNKNLFVKASDNTHKLRCCKINGPLDEGYQKIVLLTTK